MTKDVSKGANFFFLRNTHLHLWSRGRRRIPRRVVVVVTVIFHRGLGIRHQRRPCPRAGCGRRGSSNGGFGIIGIEGDIGHNLAFLWRKDGHR